MVEADGARQDVLAAWLCARIGYTPTPGLRCLGAVRAGRLIGCVGYDAWNGASCQMHMAGEAGWLTRGFLRAAFAYPFVEAGCRSVLAIVAASNVRALDINRRLGFDEVARLEDAAPDGALVLLQMRREACRWLEA